MAELRKNGSISAKALMFTILTVARTSEVPGATWDEFDLDAKVWTVPADRMKSGREHRVPLSDAAISIIEANHATSDTCSTTRPGELSNMAMLQLLRGIRDDGVTVHGFRSSFRDWAAEPDRYTPGGGRGLSRPCRWDAAELAYKRSSFVEKRSGGYAGMGDIPFALRIRFAPIAVVDHVAHCPQ